MIRVDRFFFFDLYFRGSRFVFVFIVSGVSFFRVWTGGWRLEWLKVSRVDIFLGGLGVF